jgi:hypothetical protein
LFAHGRWFFPGTPASSSNKTGRHDIAKALLNVALKTPKINQSHYLLRLTKDFSEQKGVYHTQTLW